MFKKTGISFLLILLACLLFGCVRSEQTQNQTVEETESAASAAQSTAPAEEKTGEWEAYWENQAGNGYTKRY